MELSAKQQIVQILQTAKKVLILTGQNPDGDGLGSLLALYLALKKIGIGAMAVCPNALSSLFQFLPQINKIQENLDIGKDFAITLDTTGIDIEGVGYQKQERSLKIIIATRGGNALNPEGIKLEKQPFSTDAIFILDTPDWAKLGPLFEENPDLFYEVPTVNIDHHGTNSYFGRINWVDITSSSTCEIMVSLLESLGRGKNLMDEDIATALMTGLLTDTDSFQNQDTTPKSLTVGAQLLAAGARQQEIIGHLRRAKSLVTLKLWGKVLAGIKEDKTHKFIWVKVTKEDLSAAGANYNDINGLLDEILKSVYGADFALLLIEKNGEVYGNLRATRSGAQVQSIAQLFKGSGHAMAADFTLKAAGISEVEEEIIEKIQNQRQRAQSDAKTA